MQSYSLKFKIIIFFPLIWLLTFWVLFFPPLTVAVYEEGEAPVQSSFAPNQVIVKYRLGQTPADIDRAVKQRAVQNQTLFGRLQNAAQDAQLRLQGKSLPEEALNRLHSVNQETGVVSSRMLFTTNVLGEGTPPQLAGFFLYTTDGSVPVEEMVSMYEELPEVSFAEPNRIMRVQADDGSTTPNDPLFPNMWNLDKVEIEEAWQQTTGSNQVTVAVIDTGVDFAHPDLAGVDFAEGRDFALCDGELFINANEQIDCTVPKTCANADNYLEGYCDDDPSDDYGHGTHTTGTIAAITNNNKGVAGINWKVKIMPVKVLNKEGIGYSTWIATGGIFYAVENGAKVINLSLGSCAAEPNDDGSCPHSKDTISDIYKAAIDYAIDNGVTVVVAAGNDNDEAKWYELGNYNNTPDRAGEIIVVAASGPNDERAAYSNYGSIVDLAAPGGNVSQDRNGDQQERSADCYEWTVDGRGDPVYDECILSTWWRQNLVYPLEYRLTQGTSMAAPHVAGVAALMLAKDPTLSVADIRQKLIANGDDIGTSQIGKRLNANKALLAVSAGETPTPTVTPGGPTPTPTGFIADGCPASCQELDSSYTGPGRSSGDANCDGEVDDGDFDDYWQVQWQEYQKGNSIPKSERSADFFCQEAESSSQRVDMIDFEIWRKNRFEEGGRPTATPTPGGSTPTPTPTPGGLTATPTPAGPTATATPVVASPTPTSATAEWVAKTWISCEATCRKEKGSNCVASCTAPHCEDPSSFYRIDNNSCRDACGVYSDHPGYCCCQITDCPSFCIPNFQAFCEQPECSSCSWCQTGATPSPPISPYCLPGCNQENPEVCQIPQCSGCSWCQ